MVLGRDAVGVVAAVGASVEGIAVGDKLFGHVLLAPPIQAGTLAEYAVLPAAAVAPKPAGLDFVTGRDPARRCRSQRGGGRGRPAAR